MKARSVILPIVGCILSGVICGSAHAAAEPTEREVTFRGADGVTIAGSLLEPARMPGVLVPAIVLVAGSGPTDRNGNSLPAVQADLLKQVAALLAKNGFASLRYDKRGVGASEKPSRDPAKLHAVVAWESFVGDAASALRFAQSQPGIDPARTGILGHSEGGLLALQAAFQMKDAPMPPAFLILASTPGRGLGAVIHDHLTRILALQQATPEQTKFFLDKNGSILQAIGQTGEVPGDVPPGLAALYPTYLGGFLRSAAAVDPGKLATKFAGPVMILQGEKDVQVSATLDAPALDEALRRRSPDIHELCIIPGASHNLKPVADAADPGFTGPLASQITEKLGVWLRTNTDGQHLLRPRRDIPGQR